MERIFTVNLVVDIASKGSRPSIRLRPLNSHDAPAITALCQDPIIQRQTTLPSPYTAQDGKDFCTFAERAWEEKTSFTWAICCDDSSHDWPIAGCISLKSHHPRSYEVGFWLSPSCRNRGVMSASIKAICHLAFTSPTIGAEVIHWMCEAGDNPNIASWKVAHQCGFRYAGLLKKFAYNKGELRDVWFASLVKGDPLTPCQDWEEPLK